MVFVFFVVVEDVDEIVGFVVFVDKNVFVVVVMVVIEMAKEIREEVMMNWRKN